MILDNQIIILDHTRNGSYSHVHKNQIRSVPSDSDDPCQAGDPCHAWLVTELMGHRSHASPDRLVTRPMGDGADGSPESLGTDLI